jgi:uncharacterized membrane protein
MIQLHTSHGWIRPELRHNGYWDAAQFFGGLAAPLFLFLAGAGLGLQWTAADALVEEPRGATARALARGAELVVLGYVLRLQMWIIDGAAYARLETYPSIGFLAIGYGLALLCISRIARGRAYATKHALSAAALSLAGIAWAYIFDPLRADGLIRVDVLQCIGASLMLLSAIGASSERRRPSYYIALAMSAALITPFVQRIVPGPLPSAIAGYLAQWPSADGARIVSLFPLCPWLGFAAFGVAVGLAWGRARTPADLESLLLRLMTLGAVLAFLTNTSWPPFRSIALPEPAAALLRLSYKAALCCVMIGPALALTHAPKAIRSPIALLGRSSLLVYWVHLQFAFGTVSRPLARALSIEAWAYGTALLTTCMLALAALRNTRHAMTIRGIGRRPLTG